MNAIGDDFLRTLARFALLAGMGLGLETWRTDQGPAARCTACETPAQETAAGRWGGLSSGAKQKHVVFI